MVSARNFGLAAVFAGTLMFRLLENYNWIDSLYLCHMTLSTIGFGDIYPVTAAGKVCTSVLAIIGLGLFGDLIVYYNKKWSDMRLLSSSLLDAALCWSVGGIAISFLENWPIEKAAWLVVALSTTIGYGDVVPVTDGGKLFSVFYSYWALGTTAELLATVKSGVEILLPTANPIPLTHRSSEALAPSPAVAPGPLKIKRRANSKRK